MMKEIDYADAEKRILNICGKEPSLHKELAQALGVPIEIFKRHLDIYRCLASHFLEKPVLEVTSAERAQTKVECYNHIFGILYGCRNARISGSMTGRFSGREPNIRNFPIQGGAGNVSECTDRKSKT